MEISITQPELLKLVRNVMPAISASEIPIFSCIKMETIGDQLHLSASDTRVSLKSSAGCTVKEPGAVGVSGKALADVVALLPNTTVTLAVAGSNRLQIRAGRSALHLNMFTADQFPLMTNYDRLEYVKANDFFNDMDQVAFAASKDDTRHTLQGVYIKENHIVAVDGHRMALKIHSLGLPRSVLIPADAVNRIRKVFSAESNLGLAVTESEIHFIQDNCRGTVRLLEGQFPDYMKIVPRTPHTVAVVERASLIEALKLMSIVTDNQNTVVFSFKNNQLLMSAECAEKGRAEQVIECQYEGETSIAFNAHYIKQSFDKLGGDKLALQLRQNLSPMVIEEENYMHVIMPKRIHG